MRLVILVEAEEEAEEAARWYEQRSPGLGYDFLAELRTAFKQISAYPTRPSRVNSRLEGVELRRFLLRRFPYMIVYQVIPDRVVVLATAHLKRKPQYWLKRVDAE